MLLKVSKKKKNHIYMYENDKNYRFFHMYHLYNMDTCIMLLFTVKLTFMKCKLVLR